MLAVTRELFGVSVTNEKCARVYGIAVRTMGGHTTFTYVYRSYM